MMSLLAVFGAFFVFPALVLAEGESENLVCVRSAPDAFATAIKGAKGDNGVPGIPGMVGSPGPPGRSLRKTHLSRYTKTYLEDQIAQAIFETRDVTVDASFRCNDLENKVMYEGKCFWAIIPRHEVKFLAADRLCREKGATPANIYSQQHYEQVMAYLHRLNQEFYYVYTGMEYNPDTHVLSNYDGSQATHSHWRARDPFTNVADPVSMSRVAINVLSDTEDSGNGMLTSAIIWPKKGVLCEV